MTAPRSWDYHAFQWPEGHPRAGSYYAIYPHPSVVRMNGDKKVHAITLTEDPDGDYYGWIDASRDQVSMVHAPRAAYVMCFPHGPQAEEDAGRGVTVRLTATPTEG